MTKGGPVRVLVADDDPDTAASLCGLIGSSPGLEVAGLASDGAQAVELGLACPPDVVLMDVRMPVLDGIAATARLVGGSRDSGPRVLVLTTFAIDAYLLDTLAAGASGFLPKTATWEEVEDGIHAVARGEAVLPPGLLRRLIDPDLLG